MDFKSYIASIISQALEEDEAFNDITSRYTVDANRKSEGYILLKEEAVVCGLEIARSVFKRLDKNIIFETKYKDGQKIKKNTRIASFKGRARSILSAERTALNFLGHLSGISTLTNRFVDAVKPYKAKILDTRKTTPGLRLLEKYAVKCGGGENHRMDLSDMVLVKDNHRVLLKDTATLIQAVGAIKRKTRKLVEVEVDTLKQLEYVVKASPNIILLDNLPLSTLRKAVKLVRKTNKRIMLEVSGGVNLKTVKKIAQTGVDRISIGALTHSAPSVDFSLELVK